MTALNPTFAKLGVRDEIVRALTENGIEHPFAIQELTLPLALAGDDLIGQARTGMGKTLAFGVPLLHRIVSEAQTATSGGADTDRPLSGVPRALVVVPTRELCIQVSDDLSRAAKYLRANSGAQPRDALILTKALGTGVISTAIKNSKAEAAWIDVAVQSMTTLNKQAAELIGSREYRIHAMTDVTGFGLIGHAREMALASNVGLGLFSKDIPILPGALECIRAGQIPGGLKANREFAECVVGYESGVSDELKTLLFDPQTAGGLLLSVAESDCEELVVEMQSAGIPARSIGKITESQKPLIRIY